MKIFIGGGKAKHNDRFTSRWPNVEFEFASEDESPRRWGSKALHCDHYIVLQHRTTHKHVTHLATHRIQPYFTDSIPMVHKLIKEIIDRGETRHSYSGTTRSQDAPVVPAEPK